MSARAKASFFGQGDTRSALQRAVGLVTQAGWLARLPPPAIRFYVRALRLARADGDVKSLAIAARPRELHELVRAAGGADTVAEVGTGTGWTAMVLTLARPGRTVRSFDVQVYDVRERYLPLLPAEARGRLSFEMRDGEQGPPHDLADIGFLFIDSSHRLRETMATFRLWSDRVRPGGTVAFHDYENPNFPEVAQAVAQLGIAGEARAGAYVWRKPA